MINLHIDSYMYTQEPLFFPRTDFLLSNLRLSTFHTGERDSVTMSRHKLVKTMNLDDELDDFDGGSDYEYSGDGDENGNGSEGKVLSILFARPAGF